MERIYLFNGKDLDNWVSAKTGGTPEWEVKDGILCVAPKTGSIYTKETYGDAHLHVEFMCPDIPGATGQARSNSGVYVHGCYEVQVLDSYGVDPYTYGDCGAIYSLHTPIQNATNPPDTWQTYDIIVRAARVDADGNVTENARLTLLLNGKVLHNNIILESHTPGGLYNNIVAEGPLWLQDHHDKVYFRNIWVEKL